MSKKKNKPAKKSSRYQVTSPILKVENQLKTALQYHKQGQLQQAEHLYRQIVTQNPHHADALHLLGMVAYQSGKMEAAAQLIQQAIDIKSSYIFYNNLGRVCQDQGEFALAEQHFRQALYLNPNNEAILNNLCTVLETQGKLETAKEYYQQILRIQPESAETYVKLGNIFIAQNQLNMALESYQQAVRIQPNYADAYGNMGNVLRAQNKLDMALECYQQVLQIKPDYAVAYNNMGNVFQTQNQLDKAIISYQQALRIQPNYAEAHNNMGSVLYAQNKLEAALECYQQVLRIQPDDAKTYNNMATILYAQDNLETALEYCQQALRLKPDYAEAYHNRGTVLQAQNKLELALECYQQALRLKPDYAEAYNNMGTVLQAQNEFEQALEYYQQALRLKPDCAKTYKNIGAVFEAQNHLEKASECYQQALQIKSDYTEAHYNLSLVFLKMADFTQGWREYEWRFKTKNGEFFRLKQHFKKPQWDGTSLAGRRLLVHYEQGFGDTIQFIRYLPLITGGTVIFVCQPALNLLLQDFPGIDILLVSKSDDEAQIDYDVWVYLLSLPYLFATTLDNIPVSIPYLYPDSKKMEKWCVCSENNRLNIGIVWAGNPKHSNDRNRSCSLAHFAPLAKLPNVTWFSLQKGEAAKQPIPDGMELISLTYDLEDFTDTAAVIAGLDLVISVDTAIIHLAGALGKPVWVLLPFAPDWRWWLERNDSPWYPTMRLFRQPRFGDWTSVFIQIRNELSRFGS